MAQNVTIGGASYSDVPAIEVPKTGGGTATFTDVTNTTAVASDVATGKCFYTSDGTRTQGTNSGGGSSKNVQAYLGSGSKSATSYTETNVKLTVAKTGTYKISWVGIRTTTSGTNGTQVYKNGSALGSAQTSFSMGSYGQNPTLTNQSLQEGDVLVVRVRSRNTQYAMWAANLIIEEV